MKMMQSRWMSVWVFVLPVVFGWGVVRAENPENLHVPVPLRSSPPPSASMGKASANEPVTHAAIANNTSFYNRFIADRLELGTRVIYYRLKDTTRDSFIGSINELEEDQDYAPTKLFVQYKFIPYLGVGAAYDRVRAVTRDEGGGDGTAEIKGPIFYLTGRFPNATLFTPYAELGLGIYRADFDEDANWSDGGARRMELDNTTGLALALGCDAQLLKHLSAGLYFRYTDIQGVDVTFKRSGEVMAKGEIPMSNYAFGLGVKYTF